MSDRHLSATRASALDDLSPAQRRAVLRIHTMRVLVDEPREKGIEPVTIAALARGGLIEKNEKNDKRDRRGRECWKLTERGHTVLRTEQPRLLARRSDELYTSDPSRAMRGEPEVMPLTPVMEREARERHAGFKAQQAQGERAALGIRARIEVLRRLADERGVSIRDDLRVIDRALRRVEQHTGTATDRRRDLGRVIERVAVIERRIQEEADGRAA